ncbi:MAG: DUF1569 domain-containing protein [Chitinophagaceae bacterium]|nr:DUF1569 domain-containing protein [Chitinophagaceae bacterium]
MQNLFERDIYEKMISRLHALGPESQRRWGKMNVAQMLAHCKEAFEVPLIDHKMPRSIFSLLVGWMIKAKLYNDDPWKKNLPTAPNFIIKDERDFEKEKQQLLELIDRFFRGGPEKVGRFPHPMFGRFTPEQWGQSMYKHLDHHFKQFGV